MTMRKRLERFGGLGLLIRRMALDWTLFGRQRVDFGASPRSMSSALKMDKWMDVMGNKKFLSEGTFKFNLN